MTQFGTATKAIYTFQYTSQTIERQFYLRPNCATGADEGNDVSVDLLTRIVQPDGSFYDMAYYTIDSDGNVLSKSFSGTHDLSLSYRYDPASRPISVYESTGPGTRRPLKQFFYARANDGSDLRAGKLVLEKRFNWVDILAPLAPTGSLPVVISDAYEYSGRDGSVSKRQTRYHLNTTTYAFETNFAFDPLGNVEESRISDTRWSYEGHSA